MSIRKVYYLQEIIERLSEGKCSEWITEMRGAVSGTFIDRCWGVVSWINRKVLHDKNSADSSSMSPEYILSVGRGCCADKSFLFVWAAWYVLGVRGRIVDLKHTDGYNGHSVAEIFNDGRWILVDTDHAHIYRLPDGEVASLCDLQLDPSLIDLRPDKWIGRNGVGMRGFYEG